MRPGAARARAAPRAGPPPPRSCRDRTTGRRRRGAERRSWLAPAVTGRSRGRSGAAALVCGGMPARRDDTQTGPLRRSLAVLRPARRSTPGFPVAWKAVYRFLLTPRWLGFAALMVALSAVMVGLGWWQLTRFHERN